MNNLIRFFGVAILCIIGETGISQLNLIEVSEDLYGGLISPLTPLADELGRPYLYVPSNEYGLRIYETEPVLNLIGTLDTNIIEMRGTSVYQKDSILYVCVGGIFAGSNDPPGVVTVDVSDPLNPNLMDSWIGGTNGHGTGIVRVVGNFAFVGGMSEGLIILDVSDPMNLTLVSQIIPPIDFPHTSNTPETVNARGMAIKDSLVYLCYDAGGMRVIDISDINNPVQISQFSNPILNDTGPPFYWNVPRAYNNVVLKDSLAYCAVDYCGIEIWNISDPTNAALITHWNPHDCPTGQWSESPIHTNEIAAQFECDLLFISTGSSDLMVLNIADPYNPAVADSFGTELDNIGSWGVDITDEFIYLTYIWTIVPFISNQPGIKKISYDKCSNSLGVVVEDNAVIYPNPTSDKIKVKGFPNQGHYILSNLNGMIISEGILGGGIDVVGINSGVYLLNIKFQDKSKTLKVIIK